MPGRPEAPPLLLGSIAMTAYPTALSLCPLSLSTVVRPCLPLFFKAFSNSSPLLKILALLGRCLTSERLLAGEGITNAHSTLSLKKKKKKMALFLHPLSPLLSHCFFTYPSKPFLLGHDFWLPSCSSYPRH